MYINTFVIFFIFFEPTLRRKDYFICRHGAFFVCFCWRNFDITKQLCIIKYDEVLIMSNKL